MSDNYLYVIIPSGTLSNPSMLKPDLAEKLRVLVNIHGPIAPKARPTPLSMPLGLQAGGTSPVSCHHTVDSNQPQCQPYRETTLAPLAGHLGSWIRQYNWTAWTN